MPKSILWIYPVPRLLGPTALWIITHAHDYYVPSNPMSTIVSEPSRGFDVRTPKQIIVFAGMTFAQRMMSAYARAASGDNRA